MCDAIVFALSCSKIMHCWFYSPSSLPPAYTQWITRLANMDTRLLEALRLLKSGKWSYGSMVNRELLMNMSKDIGLPPNWGDPSQQKKIPCQLIHSNLAVSCEGNAFIRWLRAFKQSLAIYLPVHILPMLMFNLRNLRKDPTPTLIKTLLGALRSATFLSTFVASIWYAVCLTRTRIGPKLFPNLPNHNMLDNKVALIGCLVCGISILIESKRRRSEMALYVLPRALYAFLDEIYLSRGLGRNDVTDAKVFVQRIERTMRWEKAIFGLSMGTVVTYIQYRPDLVRGLVRGVIGWMIS